MSLAGDDIKRFFTFIDSDVLIAIATAKRFREQNCSYSSRNTGDHSESFFIQKLQKNMQILEAVVQR